MFKTGVLGDRVRGIVTNSTSCADKFWEDKPHLSFTYAGRKTRRTLSVLSKLLQLIDHTDSEGVKRDVHMIDAYIGLIGDHQAPSNDLLRDVELLVLCRNL